MEELKLYTCGSYQLKMCASYYQDHISDRDFQFEVAVEENNINYRDYQIEIDSCNSILLKARIRCRHSNSVKYFVYVIADKRKQGLSSLLGHSGSCKVGKRVVGCCSQVSTIIWYFSFARHNKKEILQPAHYLNTYFLEDKEPIFNEIVIGSGDEDDDEDLNADIT